MSVYEFTRKGDRVSVHKDGQPYSTFPVEKNPETALQSLERLADRHAHRGFSYWALLRNYVRAGQPAKWKENSNDLDE